MLPVGTSNELGVAKVKIFCPKCHEVFWPRGQRSSNQGTKGRGGGGLDGAYFGKSLPKIVLGK